MAENFNFKSLDGWGGAIRSLETARDSMQDAGEKMKKVVLESLTRYGITGNVADAIMKAYEEDVLVLVDNFVKEVNNFIQSNKDAHTGAQDTVSKFDDIVGKLA